MINVQIAQPQFSEVNAFRGIGAYAEQLKAHLAKIEEIQLVDQNPDLIHYPFFDLFFHTLPSDHPYKVVVTIHDVIPLVFPYAYPPGIKGKIRFQQQKRALKNVDAIITDSFCSKKDIVEHLQIPEEKVHVTLLAGNPQMVEQPVGVVKKILASYGIDHPYVLYVGDMNFNKNLPRFIHATAQLPQEMHVVLVGRSLNNTAIPEGQALHKAISESGMTQRVHILTDVPKDPSEVLASLFTGSSMYVQPSLYEGFGLSVLDAMQCGVPVVSSNASSLPEVAGAAAIYVNPEEIKSIATGMNTALKLSESRWKSIKHTAEDQLKKFSWTKTAKETFAVYKSV